MDGWPAIYVISTRNIREGEELLGYYGPNFAEAMEKLESWNLKHAVEAEEVEGFLKERGVDVRAPFLIDDDDE